MQPQPPSTIKALGILHFSLLIGQIVFAAIAYYLHYSKTMSVIDMGENNKFIVLLVAAIGLTLVVAAFSIYKKKVNAIRESSVAIKDKLNAYRAASLIRWAMLEAPVIIAIIGFMLTGNYNFMILAGAILVLFISTRPTVSRATAELSVSEEELNN